MAFWLIVYAGLRQRDGRHEMLVTSLLTLPMGLTEPLFVLEYWNPPTLFGLAQQTGFHLESLVFAFALGGLAGTLYERERAFPVRHSAVDARERPRGRHRWHGVALLSPLLSFMVIYPLHWFNPIHAVVVALLIGGAFTAYCRLDLVIRMVSGAGLFGPSGGLVWSGAHEHLKWPRTAAVPRGDQNHAGDAP